MQTPMIPNVQYYYQEYIIFIWGEYLTLSMACTKTLGKVHQSSPFIKSSPSFIGNRELLIYVDEGRAFVLTKC